MIRRLVPRGIDIERFLERMDLEAKRARTANFTLKKVFDLNGKTDEELEIAAQRFRALDLDEGGTLDLDEFTKGAGIYGLSEEAALFVFAEMDGDGKGYDFCASLALFKIKHVRFVMVGFRSVCCLSGRSTSRIFWQK